MKKLLLLAVLISSLAFGQDEVVDTCYGIGNDCVAWKIEKDFDEQTRGLIVRFGYIKFAEVWSQEHYETQVGVSTALISKYSESYFISVVTGNADPMDLRTRVILQVLGNYNPGGSADLSERISATYESQLELGKTYKGVDINRLSFIQGKLFSYSISENRALLEVRKDRYVAVNIFSLH